MSTKKEIVREDVTESASAGASQTVSIMSSADSEVAGLAREQQTLMELEGLYTRTRGRVDLLALPDECEELHKKEYRFKWLAKDKNIAAKLKAGPWVLCTRVTAPFIKEHRFGVHGAVEQAGMLLGMTTERLARLRERDNQLRSAGLLKHYTEDLPSQEGFYKPKDSGSDETSEGALVEGRDF